MRIFFGCSRHRVEDVPSCQQDVTYCPICTQWFCDKCKLSIDPSYIIQPKDWRYDYFNVHEPAYPYHLVFDAKYDGPHPVRRITSITRPWPPEWVGSRWKGRQ